MSGLSAPGLAVNFVGETVGVISLSYFLHKTGYHKLERVGLPGQHRKLRRRVEFRAGAPLTKSV